VSTEFVVLLNNDTIVLDHWLDELVATFEVHDKVGLAGSQLIYANGRLQESGGLIWNDASGNNYGRGLNPQHPNYNYVRNTDYCSGACILLRTKIFKSLGGFDTRFIPAYYEDTDLAFQIASLGLKVLVNPLSKVIHLEGMTCGKSTTSGIKKSQVINQQKFLTKWYTRLSDHSAPVAQPDLELSPVENLKILVLDARIPEPNKDSGSFRMYEMLKILSQMGHKTTFLPDNLTGTIDAADELRRLGIKVVCAPFYSVKSYLKSYGKTYDVIIVSHTAVADRNLRYIKRFMPRAKVVFDTVDLGHIREYREAELYQSARLKVKAGKTKQRELSQIIDSDYCLVVSYDEKEYLDNLSLGTPIRVVSNIHNIHATQTPFKSREQIIFVGGYDHPPNRDAVQFLIEDIMPIVYELNPEIELLLIGSNMPEAIKSVSAPNITVLGFVDDLTPLLHSAKMSVAPLRYGAGVKGKINQSMSYGLPVVATTTAAEGMNLVHEVDVLIADEAEQFADQICRLYSSESLWQTISDNSTVNIDKYFSVSTARDQLGLVLNEIQSR
jgi:glycosyltransferase involved in cell wall biosynthesis